jgi:hypothetical protein
MTKPACDVSGFLKTNEVASALGITLESRATNDEKDTRSGRAPAVEWHRTAANETNAARRAGVPNR